MGTFNQPRFIAADVVKPRTGLARVMTYLTSQAGSQPKGCQEVAGGRSDSADPRNPLIKGFAP